MIEVINFVPRDNQRNFWLVTGKDVKVSLWARLVLFLGLQPYSMRVYIAKACELEVKGCI